MCKAKRLFRFRSTDKRNCRQHQNANQASQAKTVNIRFHFSHMGRRTDDRPRRHSFHLSSFRPPNQNDHVTKMKRFTRLVQKQRPRDPRSNQGDRRVSSLNLSQKGTRNTFIERQLIVANGRNDFCISCELSMTALECSSSHPRHTEYLLARMTCSSSTSPAPLIDDTATPPRLIIPEQNNKR